MREVKPLTVAALIAHLQTQPQELLVVYRFCSEWCALEADDIGVQELRTMRIDGWVHDARPDKPTQTYLTLPGL